MWGNSCIFKRPLNNSSVKSPGSYTSYSHPHSENLEPNRKKPKLTVSIFDRLCHMNQKHELVNEKEASPRKTLPLLDISAIIQPTCFTEKIEMKDVPQAQEVVEIKSSDEEREEETADDQKSDDLQIVKVEHNVVVSQYNEKLSKSAFLSRDFLEDIASCQRRSQLAKERVTEAELTISFWERQRKIAQQNSISNLETRLSCLLSSGPVLHDPYLEPQPVPSGLPYQRSVFRPKIPLPVLTEDQWAMVEQRIARCGPDTVLVDKFRLSVTKKDIISLFVSNWLTDMIVNFYMQLIHHRSLMSGDLKKTAVMSTFFFPKLTSGGFEAVRRWTRRLDLFDHELILFPIHDRGIHWCLAVADLSERQLTYYDSMGGANQACLNRLHEYLKAEHQSKRGTPLPKADDWELFNAQDTSPQQENGSDCGVFACMVGEFVSRAKSLDFSQDDMPAIRQRMMYEILFSQLLTTETDLSQA